VVTLEGAVVSLAGEGSHLAVVWHRASPTDEGDQLLSFAVYDLPTRQQIAGGPLPLSPASSLSWLGFSQAGPAASFDSKVGSFPSCIT
jgi:chromosome transmission fidelity protein 4